jgi:pyruvate,water dikinase
MTDQPKPIDRLLHDLGERAKELNCLYKVQELLGTPNITIEEICEGIIQVLPPGWQYPDVCEAQIIYNGNSFRTPSFTKSAWVQSAEIVVQDEVIGKISVCYLEERPASDEGPFLKEERKLINTIAEQFGFYILHQKLRQVFQEQLEGEGDRRSEWRVIFDLLKRTDPALLMRISRKMIHHLGWNGVKGAEQLLDHFILAHAEEGYLNENRPFQGQVDSDLLGICDQVFEIASKHLSKDLILDNIQKWTKEERVNFLVNALGDPNSSLADISLAMERYRLLSEQGIELTASREEWFRVTLIRRLLNDQQTFIKVAKQYIDIGELGNIMRRVIYPPNSHGKLGGKGSGLFLAAQVIKEAEQYGELLQNIKTPKTWYLTSDSFFYFMSYNNIEDIVEQKYKELNQVRQEYPYVMHIFKSSPLPPEITKALSLALDDFGEVPLIVRSSSLLEDRSGATFAGKYKSLFIANKGTKEERLSALTDAVTEVLASMFGPDPIEYRAQHSLIDQHEEMGVLIQEVVGTRVGYYYLPAFAGVAFSHNDFRWSGRIKREDGLLRLVPGLGTRAVDRLIDDYPVLIAPGQPNLRVNITPDEIFRYATKKIDVINLKTRKFETVEINKLLREYGAEYPVIKQLISLFTPNGIQPPGNLTVDFKKEQPVVTFEGLFSHTTFLKQMHTILNVLEDTMGYPVDIEFAHDGNDFYLLQCRAQSHSEDSLPAAIPKMVLPEKVIFSANRYVSNGSVPDITYIVYVDPQKYCELQKHQDLVAVGRAIGELNKVLPKRKFILMGPGRWGSRGDIKLGVNVTYSDINNTAMLIEIARKQKDYFPEPSFGTHFFQDLVEASIHYLPLYPDDGDVIFNEHFLTTQCNALFDVVPDFAHLADVIQVIDIPASADGQCLHVLMNADQGRAVAILSGSRGEIKANPE